MKKTRALLPGTLAFGMFALLLMARTTQAASPTDPDWPCIQPKVPQIAAGQIWNGPPVEEIGESWREDPVISDLAQKLSQRRTSLEEAKILIGNFAGGLQGDKSRPLTALFAGTLALINGERTSIIAGIGRYTKRQRALSKKIEDEMAELGRLPQDDSEDSVSQRQDLLDVQAWDVRIFQEREKSLRYVCEQPVLLEQRAFAIGRDILAHLK